MRRVMVFIVILALGFPALAHAKRYGPLWAVWTHSEKPEHCAVKTVFWMAVVTVSVVYVANKVIKEPDIADFAIKTHEPARRWQPAVWPEQDLRGEEFPVVGIRITW